MEQIAQYRSGERDYTLIKGGTGPLVYPAAHVYIYNGLYRLTNGGTDIFRAQFIFAVLYLGVLGIVMACYRMAKVASLLRHYFFNVSVLIAYRHLHTSFPSSSSPSAFIASSFFDCLTTASLWHFCSWLSTSTKDGYGRSVA